jgi:hypothetical protein
MNDRDETYAQKIREDCMSSDYEADHGNADDILVALLTELGYHETVKAWEAVGKWYA